MELCTVRKNKNQANEPENDNAKEKENETGQQKNTHNQWKNEQESEQDGAR